MTWNIECNGKAVLRDWWLTTRRHLYMLAMNTFKILSTKIFGDNIYVHLAESTVAEFRKIKGQLCIPPFAVVSQWAVKSHTTYYSPFAVQSMISEPTCKVQCIIFFPAETINKFYPWLVIRYITYKPTSLTNKAIIIRNMNLWHLSLRVYLIS